MLRKPFYGRLFFDPDGGNNPAGSNPPADPTGTPPPAQSGTPPNQGDAQVTLTQADLDARMAAARKDGKESAERAAREAQAAADAAAKQQQLEAAGEYETAKATLISERDALKGENEALSAYFATQYANALKALPEFIVAFAPADDASFAAKSAWLVKAQEQAVKVAEQTGTVPGNRPNPSPGGVGDAVKQATERMRHTISI